VRDEIILNSLLFFLNGFNCTRSQTSYICRYASTYDIFLRYMWERFLDAPPAALLFSFSRARRRST